MNSLSDIVFANQNDSIGQVTADALRSVRIAPFVVTSGMCDTLLAMSLCEEFKKEVTGKYTMGQLLFSLFFNLYDVP